MTTERRFAALVAITAGAASLAIMIARLDWELAKQWYFYSGILLLAGMTAYFFGWLTRGDRLLWRGIQWWSGLWGCLFLSVFIPPHFTVGLVSYLAPMLERSGVHPFLAGFVHLAMWGCASDILKPEPEPLGGAAADHEHGL